MSKINKKNKIKNKSIDKREGNKYSKYLVPAFAVVLILFSGYYLIGHDVISDGSNGGNGANPVKKPLGNFKELDDKPSTYEKGKVKVIEFMKFDCGHCYMMEKELPQLLGKYGDTLELTVVPMSWGTPDRPAPTASIEAYIIAEEMGKGKEMKEALFNAAFVYKRDINGIVTIELAAKSIDLGEEFNSRLESGYAREKAMNNIKNSTEYSVDETPTFIINGNIKVTPSGTGGDMRNMAQNLDTIIGSLL